MSPKEDAFHTMRKRLWANGVRMEHMEDAYYFKTCNIPIMVDLYNERNCVPAWQWPIMVW
jgi:hypothetical protein